MYVVRGATSGFLGTWGMVMVCDGQEMPLVPVTALSLAQLRYVSQVSVTPRDSGMSRSAWRSTSVVTGQPDSDSASCKLVRSDAAYMSGMHYNHAPLGPSQYESLERHDDFILPSDRHNLKYFVRAV